jgi:hypothetical protein
VLVGGAEVGELEPVRLELAEVRGVIGRQLRQLCVPAGGGCDRLPFGELGVSRAGTAAAV